MDLPHRSRCITPPGRPGRGGPPVGRRGTDCAFAAVAVGFGYYAWRRYRSDLKAAELTEEERRELEAES